MTPSARPGAKRSTPIPLIPTRLLRLLVFPHDRPAPTDDARVVRLREGSYLLCSNHTRKTPGAVLEKFCAVQMVDVHLPTTDGRTVILPRHTQPEKELQVLLDQLKLTLPAQPPPKITADKIAAAALRV